MESNALSQAAQDLGLELTSSQLEAFAAFEGALYRANEVMNLTRVPREECWRRHFLDSLLLSPLIPLGASVLDIGTGPGFPAWPLALARPDLQVTALDSSGKMIGFLRGGARGEGAPELPNLVAIQARAEEWDVREAFDFVTGRALAPLPVQLELSAAPCKVGGLVVPMRTPAEEGQLDDEAFSNLGLRLDRVERASLVGTDVVRAFPVYEKVRATPARFPRKWAEMKARPLG